MLAQPFTKKSLSADNPAMDDLLSGDDAEICLNCGNIYRVDLFKVGEDHDNCGCCYCPFCGVFSNGNF